MQVMFNWMDMLFVFPTEYLEFWLVNKGSGTIFLCLLVLRPLKTPIYPEVHGIWHIVLHADLRWHATDVLKEIPSSMLA